MSELRFKIGCSRNFGKAPPNPSVHTSEEFYEIFWSRFNVRESLTKHVDLLEIATHDGRDAGKRRFLFSNVPERGSPAF